MWYNEAMDIKYFNVNDIKPYEKNAKSHPQSQVERIARSIKEFGFKQPLVIDKNNVVIIGHGRLLASKMLGLEEIPCVMADDLDKEQIKALRLADNKVAESEWDMAFLREELNGILDIDMMDFGFTDDDFELPDDPDPIFEDDLAPSCQHNVFENQELMQFPIENYYGIPVLSPTQTTGDKFLRFMDWKEVDDPSEYIAHFYYDDYKFMAAWREPDKYVERLKQFKAVICPDFSSYTDFPIALQILGAYRRNWCGAYWQSLGIDMIPDVQWGDNEETYKWCFEGIPENATVAISSLGVAGKNQWNGIEGDWFKRGFDEMIKRLHPSTILWYGNKVDGCEGNIIYIPSFYEEKRAYLNAKTEEKKNGKRK